MNKKLIIGIVATLGLIGGFAAFRPDTLFTTTQADEALPQQIVEAEVGPSFEGDFVSLAHPTEGHVEVFETEDGAGLIRFTGFTTDNGPDLIVTAMIDGERVELGKLKGTMGDQNYDVASLDELESVQIWCRRFNVDFGQAELMAS